VSLNSRVPKRLAVLLDEVGVPVDIGGDLLCDIGPEWDAGVGGRSYQRKRSRTGLVPVHGLEAEVAELLDTKEPLGVAPGRLQILNEWRQARDDEHHRQRWFLLVLGFDEGAEQRAEGILVLARLVVQSVGLVVEEGDAAPGFRGEAPDLDQSLTKAILEDGRGG